MGFVTTIAIALITYILGLHSSRKQSLREARLKAYGDLVAFTSTFKVTSQHIIDGEYSKKLIELISPARLLASDKTENKMRDYFDEFICLCESLQQGKEIDKGKRLSQISIDLEESMRVDLEVRFYPRRLSIKLDK